MDGGCFDVVLCCDEVLAASFLLFVVVCIILFGSAHLHAMTLPSFLRSRLARSLLTCSLQVAGLIGYQVWAR